MLGGVNLNFPVPNKAGLSINTQGGSITCIKGNPTFTLIGGFNSNNLSLQVENTGSNQFGIRITTEVISLTSVNAGQGKKEQESREVSEVNRPLSSFPTKQESTKSLGLKIILNPKANQAGFINLSVIIDTISSIFRKIVKAFNNSYKYKTSSLPQPPSRQIYSGRKISSEFEVLKREEAKLAFEALALAELGIVTKDNLEEVKNLFTTIAQKAGNYTSSAYNSLRDLAETVKKEDLILPLNIILWGMDYLNLKENGVTEFFNEIKNKLFPQPGLSIINLEFYLEQFILSDYLNKKGEAASNTDIILTPWIAERITDSGFNSSSFLQQLFQLDLKRVDLASLSGLSEEKKSLIYNKLYSEYKTIMQAVPYNNFWENSIVQSIFSYIQNKAEFFYLSDKDRSDFIALGLSIEEKIRDYFKKTHSADASYLTSFREQIQLHRNFIQLYLRNYQEKKLKIDNLLSWFILLNFSFYADMLGSNELGEFKRILQQAIEEHFDLFVRLSLVDSKVDKIKIGELIDRLQYASFEDLEGKKEIPSYAQGFYWALRRAKELARPALVILGSEERVFFDHALKELSQEAELYYINCHSGLDRELFVQNLPQDESSQITQIPGILTRLIKRAKDNPNQEYFLVFENAEAMPAELRVAFNPVLWEKRFYIPELREQFDLPSNLHLIFTMSEDSVIKDEAFLNRLQKIRVGRVDEKDLIAFFKDYLNIKGEDCQRLSSFYFSLNSQSYQDSSLEFSIQDMLNIGSFARERGLMYLGEECYRYFNCRFRFKSDLELFEKEFEKIFGQIESSWRSSTIILKDNQSLAADGVEIELSQEAKDYLNGNPTQDFFSFMLEKYGYVLRKQDLKVISQLVRLLQYHNEPNLSRFVILEGISGEGKTQLVLILARLLGKKSLCYTVHKYMDTHELEGGISPQGHELKVLAETEFTSFLRQGNSIINFSELNTSLKQTLAFFLASLFRQDKELVQAGIPAGGIPKVKIDRSNLFVADINPLDYKQRENLPNQLRRQALRYWMGYDYSSSDPEYAKEIKQELTTLFRSLFYHYTQDEHRLHAQRLADIYLSLQRALYTNTLVRYQVLTLREIIRIIRLFKETGNFESAVRDVFYGMWLEEEVAEKIKSILEEKGISCQGYGYQELISFSLKENIAPLLIQSTSYREGFALLKEILSAKFSRFQLHYLSVSDFLDYSSFVSGPGVDKEENVSLYPGALLKVMEACLKEPTKTHILVLDGFEQLNPDTAVGFNRILQDGIIQIPKGLLSVLKKRLEDLGLSGQADQVYGRLPSNLRIIGISYSHPRPTSSDRLPMSGAELSRFISVRLDNELSQEKIARYLKEELERVVGKTELDDLLTRVKNIFEGYQQQEPRGIVLSRRDLDELIQRLKQNPALIRNMEELLYSTLGCALPSREEFEPQITIPRDGRLILIKELMQVYSALFSAVKAGRRVFLLEGPPGVGKTALAEDFAQRENLTFKKVSMYSEIELWDFIGRIEFLGNNRFRFTGSKDGLNRFQTDFLDFIENGGVFCFDEANLSKSSLQVLTFLMHLLQNEEIDLGLYHNGVELDSQRIKVNPRFYVFVTYNPATTTSGRKKIIRELGLLAKKVWISDQWSDESYLRIIEHYDTQKKLSSQDKERMIKLQRYIKYLLDEDYKDSLSERELKDIPELVRNFRLKDNPDTYLQQFSLSPRELIRCVEMAQKESLFEGILLNYANQFVQEADFEAILEIIDTVFKGFKDWYLKKIEEQEKKITSSIRQITSRLFFLPVGSQISSLYTLGLSIQKGATMLLSADGSWPYELVNAFCELNSFELRTFWGNSFSNSLELLAGKGLEFSHLNENGLATFQKESELFGFIGEYLVEKGRAPPEDIKPTILYLGSLDVLSSDELERLNDFLQEGQFDLGQKTYVLAPNVHIVVEAPLNRQRHFSSAFFDRFQKVRVGSLLNFKEMEKYLDRYYSGLSALEKEFIFKAVVLAWFMDTERTKRNEHNLLEERFSRSYGFGLQDIKRLAELVMLERQTLKEQGTLDPVEVVLKAVLRLYGQSLDDTNQDRQKFLKSLLNEVLNFEGIDEESIREQEASLRQVTIRWISQELKLGQALANGIRLEQKEGRYILVTPGNRYLLELEPEKETQLSEGLKVKRLSSDTYQIQLGLIDSIGGMSTAIEGDSLRYALPPEEVSPSDYLVFKGVIAEVGSTILWAIRRTQDTAERQRLPYPIFLTGPTGGAKNTLVRNFSWVLGMPLVTLNCFEGMEADSLVGAMQLKENRRIEFQLSEFFSQLGKINGRHIYPQEKTTHSQRKILFLDEANVSPQILYLLRPLFEGRREFDFYYLGMKYHIELDPEVILIISGNPSDRFEGRQAYPNNLLQKAVKVWVPSLHEYRESERIKREDAARVLEKMHEAKIGTSKDLGQRELPRYMNNASSLIILKRREFSQIKQRERTPSLDKKGERMPAEQKNKTKVDIQQVEKRLKYSLSEIKEALEHLDFQQDKLTYFIEEILPGFALALTDGGIKIKEKDQLREKALATAKGIDIDVYKFMQDLIELYNQDIISEKKLKGLVLTLRRSLLKKDLNIFLFSFALFKEKEDRIYLLLVPFRIKQRIELNNATIQGLNLPGEVLERLPLYAYAVDNHPLGEDVMAKGVYKGHSDEEGYYALCYIGSTGPDSEKIDWVGYHELGHLITELRIRFEQLAPPDVELFSMLFPLLFSSDPKRYLKEGLLSWLLLVKDKDSSYCQSAKGILNAFLRILKAKDKSIQFSEITDDFEEDRINAITDLILKLAPEKIKWYAALVYTNAYEKKFKGDYYLNTTKKGKYKRIERGTIRGDSIFEITEGEILQPPDVETEDLPDSKKVDIEQKIKIKSDVQNKEERGKTERDIERVGMPGKGEGKKPADIQRIKGSWVEEYVRVFSRYAQRIIEVFSQEPEVEERYSKSGRTIDLKRYLLGLQNIFKRRFYLDSRPALCFGITVDVSGSITGNPTLVNSFTQLARFYLSLMFKLASLYRQGVYYGLSAIGENFHPGLKFSNRHTQETLEDLVYGNDYRWMINFNDGGGINTINLIQGLREKWQDASLPEENRIEIIFTDGQETSGSGEEHFRYLRKLVSDFERDTKVKVIFVGIGTPEVRNYTRYIELSSQPNPEEFIRIIVRLGEMLTQKGRLPEGDLAEALQVEHKPASVKQASVVASQKGEEDLAKKANLDFTNQQVFTDLSGFAFQDGHYQILNDGSVRIGEEVIRVGEGGLLYPVRVYEAQPDWFER